MTTPTPVLLVILDGWGIGEPTETNAVHMARTPNMDAYCRDYPFTTLLAHDGAVGLPEGQMGNSEVGHLNIGAGRVVYQDYTRINKAIADGELARNQVFTDTVDAVKNSGGTLHLLGLVSDGGVHSHQDHLLAMVRLAAERGLSRIAVHAFMDGRDTPPQSGVDYLRIVRDGLAGIGTGTIATVIGRYYAMDRDRRWDRVALAWAAMVDGEGTFESDPVEAVRNAYGRGETDEFIKPVVLTGPEGQPVAPMRDGDGVIFFNFRADRARQLTRAFTDPRETPFPMRRRPQFRRFVTCTRYDKDVDLPILFPPQGLERILGSEVSRLGLAQLRIAETEKYAHVTYFFNGGREAVYPGEDRALIDSPRDVATYDLKPEMSAPQVTEELLRRMAAKDYGLIVLNFANGDMVGHSGVLAAAIKACETVDSCLGRVVEAFRAKGGVVLVTADHGNAEMMYDPVTCGPHTAHTLNPVPCVLVSDAHRGRTLRAGGALRDLAPTILSLMGLPVPEGMDGRSLLV